ncbi:hypothetical protein PAMA_019983 [Pampus argenteus]
MCRCHVLGSVGSCDQLTGSCKCDHLASGTLCDRCMAGFWGLGDSGLRCSPCDCDMGGADSITCSSHDGQCHCLPNMVGRRCTDPAPGYFLPPLDYFLYEAELAAPLVGISSSSTLLSPTSSSSFSSSSLVCSTNDCLMPDCEQYFRQQGYDFKFSNGQVVVVRRTRHARWRRQIQQSSIPLDPGHALQIIPRQRPPDQPITWTGLGLVRVLDGAGLRFTVDNLPSSIDYQLVIRYEPETPSDWLLSVNIIMLSPGDGSCSSDPTGSKIMILPGNSRGSILDPAVCLNAGGRYFVDITFNKQPGSEGSHILIDSMGLIPNLESISNFCSQNDLDSFRRFRCIGFAVELGSQELLPEVCEGLIRSMSARIHNGAVLCRCNVVGSLGPSCSKVGGLCECKPNVIGRCCDTCAPLTFGFGLNGCKPCECDPRGSVSEMCDQVRGQCACLSEVTGRRCGHCRMGFWGFPHCQPCDCNGLSEICDEQSGECLNCRGHATGPHCDRCLEGYYGNPVSRQPCQPCLCPDVQSSGRFFATSCHHNPQSLSLTCNCREGHTGLRCDRCSPGFYGDLTLPGKRCEKCFCNNNIDPDDHDACDSVTGECLHCLHNTTGPRCQNCKLGYYGNALDQECKECSCDRRGTEVTQCPLGSPCFCDWRTGQCPCRMGVMGVLCNECEDGYWNLDGVSGCQPCSCDPANSFSNICNKMSGQCLCHPEFGGRQCDECGENHFWNPDLQCISCDCNMEGTLRPSCDPETGECMCRVGVTGIFCDECAPGYDSTFPTCEECHPCASLWAENVTDVQRAAQRMRTFIPRHGDDLQPGHGHHQQLILEMHSKLEGLTNLTGLSPLKVEKVEKLYLKIRKLKDSIDPNMILINPYSLLNTEIDNIHHDFKKLLNNLKEKLMKQLDDDEDDEDLEELSGEIHKLYDSFLSDEKRVRNANEAVEDSVTTRQEVKHKLSKCSSKGDMAPLEKIVKALSVVSLNRMICGGPGLEDCSGCGGALCRLPLGNRKCGGPNCDGIVPFSIKASETAEKVKDKLIMFPVRLLESKNKAGLYWEHWQQCQGQTDNWTHRADQRLMGVERRFICRTSKSTKQKEVRKGRRTNQIIDVQQVTQDTKALTKDLQDRINNNMDTFERDKNKTKELIQRVKDYLLDEMIPPEDIEKMARAVLDIQLPRSPDEIRSMINDINNLLSNATNFQKDLKTLEEQAKTTQDLLQKARELKELTKDIDVTEINNDIYGAEKAQDIANDDLETASQDRDTTKDQIREITDKLDDIELKLMSHQPKELLYNIDALKKKTEQNREQAKEAREAADSATDTTTETQMELDDVRKLFDVLKQKNKNQTVQDEASKRLKNIIGEAETLKRQVEDKLRLVQDVEEKIQQLINSKEQKAAEVAILLETVDTLRKEISKRAEEYISCSS